MNTQDYVVELGAGTGEVTKALLAAGIAPERLVLVERDPDLAAFLRSHFAGLKIIEGDAAQLPRLLALNSVVWVATIVSGLPLLSLPPHVVPRVVHGVFESLLSGRALVQFTYGPAAPKPEPRCAEQQAHLAQRAARGRLDVHENTGRDDKALIRPASTIL